MSKYGGSEKKNNTSFCCSISQAEALDSLRGTRWRPTPLSEDESSAPLLPRFPLPLYQRVLQDWGTLVGKSLLDFTGPLTPPGVAPPSPAACCPDKLSSQCPFDPPSLTRKNSMQFLWCAPAHLPLLSPANLRDRIRLFWGGYCLSNESAW